MRKTYIRKTYTHTHTQHTRERERAEREKERGRDGGKVREWESERVREWESDRVREWEREWEAVTIAAALREREREREREGARRHTFDLGLIGNCKQRLKFSTMVGLVLRHVLVLVVCLASCHLFLCHALVLVVAARTHKFKNSVLWCV